MTLDNRKAYMLRDDGKVLDGGYRHPYILAHYDDSLEENMKMLFLYNKGWLPWILENTRHPSTKEKVSKMLNLFVDLVYSCDEPIFGIRLEDIVYLIQDLKLIPIIRKKKRLTA